MNATCFDSGNAGTLRGTTRLIPLLLLGTVLLTSTSAGAQSPGTWTLTGSMSIPRTNAAAAQLLSGKVLVAGGFDGTTSRGTAELYDPSTGKFSSTGNMVWARENHTATLLQNGRVLITGGINNSGSIINAAEIYDPSTGRFSSTGSMSVARDEHTATLLPDGRVLIAGGVGNNSQPVASAEIYNPASGTFSMTGSMHVGRDGHTATLLADGKVLVAGGELHSSAELYDLSTGTFAITASMADFRAFHTATLLPDHRVLIAGGFNGNDPLNTAELYDPASETFSATGNMTVAHDFHTATLLASGQVLIAGGGATTFQVAELYDIPSGTFSKTGSLNDPRFDHVASLLRRGTVLAAGGRQSSNTVNQTAELYTPPSIPPVRIMTPVTDSTVAGTVNIFTAVDSQVVWINFYVDGQYSASSPPFNFAWDSTKVGNGIHTITARAFDASGHELGASAINLLVNNKVVTAFTQPLNGNQVHGTARIVTILNSPAAWENVYIDSVYFASSPPDTFSWDTTTVSNGSHTISIKAFNGSGTQVGSDNVTAKVNNGAVALTFPRSGATVAGQTFIDSMVSSQVSWINVYIDGTFLVSSPPDIFTWNSSAVPNGSHTISAKAFNSSGQQIGSTAATVTVGN